MKRPANISGSSSSSASRNDDLKKRVKFSADIEAAPFHQSTAEDQDDEDNGGFELEDVGRRKRGTVKSDVYGSDQEEGEEELEDGGSSGDEEEGPRHQGIQSRIAPELQHQMARERVAGQGSQRDEDDDMFADSTTKNAPRQKKRILKSDEIEGQEWNEDEPQEDGAPAFTAFNMDKEMEEGHFDESGHYHARKDVHAAHDTWLQDVSKQDIERAKIAREREEARLAQKELEDNADPIPDNPNELWRMLWDRLSPGESVLSALQKLAGSKGSQSLAQKWKKKKKVVNADAEDGAFSLSAADQDRQSKILKLTRLADKLMSLGHYDVYDKSHDQLTQKLRQLGLLEIPSMYEYKWDLNSSEKFGPYSKEQIMGWKGQGFFDHAPVYVRKVSAPHGSNEEFRDLHGYF